MNAHRCGSCEEVFVNAPYKACQECEPVHCHNCGRECSDWCRRPVSDLPEVYCIDCYDYWGYYDHTSQTKSVNERYSPQKKRNKFLIRCAGCRDYIGYPFSVGDEDFCDKCLTLLAEGRCIKCKCRASEKQFSKTGRCYSCAHEEFTYANRYATIDYQDLEVVELCPYILCPYCKERLIHAYNDFMCNTCGSTTSFSGQ